MRSDAGASPIHTFSVSPPGSADGGGFVGRNRELAALVERFEAVRDRSRTGVEVVFLAGEPGIGKTRLAREFAAPVRARGGVVLGGRCYEGEWAPPYGPWVEALGDHLGAVAPARLAVLLGDNAPLLARLSPAVAAVLPDLAGGSVAAPRDEEERFHLFDAVSDLLRDLAEHRPVVVLLDDLHWADAGSLALIRHLVRRRDIANLMLIGTYRDVGLDHRHPLNDLLAALPQETGRPAGSFRLRLKGLPRIEAAALLEQAARRSLAPDLVRALVRETGGNPFFLHEFLRHLLLEGRLAEQSEAGRWAAGADSFALGIPEGIRQVVEGRVARLRPESGRLLTSAAAFTGGFDFRVAQELTGLDEDALLDALDEAIAAGLLQPVDGRAESYDFVHSIVRQTLIESWTPSRRIRLHRRAAEALRAAYPQREAEFAAELAAQYHASAALAGATDGIPFALLAADRARDAFAREQEVTFLRIARDLGAQASAETRSQILARLAVAEAEAVLIDDAVQTVDQTLAELAAAGADDARVAAFIAAVARPLVVAGAPESIVRPLAARGLALVGERRDLTWARLTTLFGPVEPLHRGYLKVDRWLGYDPEALAVIRREGEPVDYARSLDPLEPATRQETEHLLALTETWDNPAAIRRALRMILRRSLYRHGTTREVEEFALRLLAVSVQSGAIPGQADALTYLTRVYAARGEFDRARETQARAVPLLARLGPAHRLNEAPFWMEVYLALSLDGDWPKIAAYWTRLATHPVGGQALFGVHWAAIAAQAHARAGAEVETRRILAELVPLLETVGLDFYGHAGAVAMAAGAAWDLELADAAPRLRRLAERQIAAGVGDVPSTSRHLTVARMAALEGDLPAALAAFAAARVVLEADGQRPLRAIADYDEALARRRTGQRQATIGPLAEAARLGFLALGMTTWAERAAALSDGGPSAAPPFAATGLTPRELDVLRLIARGLSDRQIGQALGVSARTVSSHVRHMLAKTTLDNRTELSVWAVERGLVASSAA